MFRRITSRYLLPYRADLVERSRAMRKQLAELLTVEHPSITDSKPYAKPTHEAANAYLALDLTTMQWSLTNQ